MGLPCIRRFASPIRLRNCPRLIALGCRTGDGTKGVLIGTGVAVGKGMTVGLGVANGVGVVFGALFVTTTTFVGVGVTTGTALGSPTMITRGLFGVGEGVDVCANIAADEKEKSRRVKENANFIEKPLDE